MNTEIDNFPVNQLQIRFNLGKQAIYNRLDTLEIKPFKEGNRSYITAEQLHLLDQLHEHINQGGKMAEFKKSGVSPVGIVESPVDSNTANNLEILVQVVSTGVEKAIASSTSGKSPLWYMMELKRAADEGWLLTTKEVKELIAVKPKAKKGEKTYKRGNWLFIKSGKIGNQTAWKVIKEES